MNEKNSGAVADNPAASQQGARAHDDETRALIEHHTLFQGVPTDILEALVRDREIRQLAAGDILLQPGQENTNLYLLLSGQLRVHIGTVDSDSSFLIKPDECAGEISVVDNKPPTAFVGWFASCRSETRGGAGKPSARLPTTQMTRMGTP